jgi:cation diffusion facilitator family transporter
VASSGSTKIVVIALVCNFGIAVAKFTAAAWTQSSAMLSEAIHSLVDTSNQALLLFGIHRSQRPADAQHPFGYSKELYFWSFVVAILLFSLGAGVSIYEGFQKLLHPHPVTSFTVNYIVLAVAFALEGYTAWRAITEFETRRGARSWIAALRLSKDAALFTVLLEDIAAVAGLLIAFVGLLTVQFLGIQEADGIASILIGLILATVAIFMSIEIKGLLVGEAASPKVQAGLREILQGEVGPSGPLLAINEIRTMHLGPEDVLAVASVDAADGVPAEEVEALTAQFEREIMQKFPEVRRLYIETQSRADHRAAIAAEKSQQPPRKAPPAKKSTRRAKRPTAAKTAANRKTKKGTKAES